jgi:hypothetical protein
VGIVVKAGPARPAQAVITLGEDPSLPRSITIAPPDPGAPLPGAIPSATSSWRPPCSSMRFWADSSGTGRVRPLSTSPASTPGLSGRGVPTRRMARSCSGCGPGRRRSPGAFWLQAAKWVAAGRALKCCQRCKRWFNVPHTAQQTRVGFCSDACRLCAYRAGQDLAGQMAAAGRLSSCPSGNWAPTRARCSDG